MIIKPEPVIIKVNLERIESPLEEDEEMDFFKIDAAAAVPKTAFAGKIWRNQWTQNFSILEILRWI